MKIKGVPPEFVIERDDDKCIRCKVCENQCSFSVHAYDDSKDMMEEEEYDCVGCHRCESLCPTNSLKIRRHL